MKENGSNGRKGWESKAPSLSINGNAKKIGAEKFSGPVKPLKGNHNGAGPSAFPCAH